MTTEKVESVCVIPCFNRPEFLSLCLLRIQMADHWNEVQYLFAVDWGYSQEIKSVIDAFPATHKHVRFMERHNYGATKQSLNVLDAYRVAVQMVDGLVYMVEEDVMIARDFFVWHELVHRKEQGIFCSIATRNNNRIVPVDGNDLEAYYKTSGDYQSLGVCFKSDVLKYFVLPHITKDYLQNPVQYCMKEFKRSAIGSAFAEQDGLIRRIEEECNKEQVYQANDGIAFPHVPRAFHAGFYGKNRGKRLTGNFPQRLEVIKKIIFDDSEMKRVNGKSLHLYEDSRPVNLETPYLNIVHLKQPQL